MIEFLGNAATIVYVPRSDARMAQPTPTYNVMREFYTSVINYQGLYSQDEDYKNALRSSLGRLENREDAINEWKSYCESMASYYHLNMQPKWDYGVVDIFDRQQWNQFQYWMILTHLQESIVYEYATDKKVVPIMPMYTAHVGCPLVAGTSILLANGKTCLVEKLRPNDQLHPGLKSQADPIASESYTHCFASRSKVELIGFNGEQPFAAPGQSFFTSTGLRAVDPKSAMANNPFLRVGKLAVGHIIYRRNGERYEHIEVNSIERTKNEEQTVYSVFLGANQEYYHANGYLISQNNPENALQKTIDAIRKVPSNKRMSLLLQFKELSSMFGQYGRKTIEERLNFELLHKPEADKWNLLNKMDTTSAGDTGHLNLDSPANRKNKAVPLDQLRRRYELTAHHPEQIPGNYKLPFVDVIDGCVVVDDEVQLSASYDRKNRTFKWTREIANTKSFEHGMLRIYQEGLSGHGAVFITSNENPDRVSKDSTHTFDVLARSGRDVQSRSSALGSGRGYIGLDEYHITVERSVWDPDTERGEVRDPIDFGEFTYGFYDEGDKATIPYIQFPLLNNIQESINTKFNKDLDDLYRIECATLEDNTFRGTVRFHRASTVPLISDSGDNVDVFDVKFPDLGLNLNLPILFQEFYIDLDIFDDFSYGAIYEFDPEMRGSKGNRHLLKAEYVGNAGYFRKLRSKVSQAFALARDPSASTLDSQQQKPSSITDELTTFVEPNIQLLLTFPSYNEDMVHNTVQQYMQKMMYYHMDQDDRQEFTNMAKPDDLPPGLADNLPTALKKFFHDKYAPAFLCRSISSFDKYTSKFTEKERKNLWYWWEGNGDKCLSRSQEYNDLNNLISIEVMKTLYKYDLDPFINSSEGADYWAQQLFNKLSANRIMNNLLTNPIQNGGNAINRSCVLMNTLAPSQNFADEWFENVVAYAGVIGLDYPYIDEDSELAGQWLHDSIRDLIIKVLMDDPSISKEVKEALMEDILEFEKANNLDQTETAERRAANMVAKQAIFLAEAQNWFTAVGRGLSKALGATRLYQWLGTAFDQVSGKVSDKLPATKSLKGLSTLCMAAFYIGQIASNIVGLIQNWELLEPDQKATVILETLKIVSDGVSYAMDSFKKFKNNPMNSAVDRLDVEALNQGTYRALGESGADLGKMSEKINGPGGFHESVANHVGAGEKTPTRPSGKESWNEKVSDPVGDLPPGGEAAAKKFSMKATILKGIDVALGIGVAVAMTFTLVREWDQLTTAGKIINTLSVITQVLTVLLDIAELGAAAGLWAITGTFSVALPIIGAVLAVVGVVLMILGLFIDLYKSDPPPDPLEEYIKNTGRPLIAQFNDAPEPQLTYQISHSKVTPGQLTSIEISAENKTNQEVNVANTRISLLSGNDDTCLFAADDKIVLVSDTNPQKDTENHLYVTPNKITDANLPTPSKLGTTSLYYQYDLRLAGPKVEGENALQSLILKPAEKIRSVWKAKINKKGSDEDNTSSRVDIVELTKNDKSHVEFILVRG